MNSILKLVIILGTLSIITGALITTFFFINSKNELRETVTLTSEEEKELEQLASGEKEFQVSDESEDGRMSERVFSDRLHGMTHQKVYAEEKWGYVPITEKSIDLMLEILEESDYTHQDFYKQSLLAWKDGDFSNAVKVHNVIWNSKGGNVGKAQRLLTPQEEMDYRIEHQN
ncbi:DUF6241 domain-containing protein [Salinicoccus halodurans]|uniref:Uncharacterized protein n=1 Tax=Salinicoccus halodurans TaxID=407035 RepID=A0AA94HD49_9STAP|nr:DUF6241 domain-containing protein [Salinicoccus halodurans]SFK51777.1 hypothetical protein SAMN05216235_0103 [Salinicoccus halodurans]